MGIEGTYFNIIKAIYDKLTTNIIINWKKLKMNPLRSRTSQGCLFSPPVLSIEVLATVIRKEKEIKSIQIGMGEVKLSFVQCIVLCLKDLEVWPRWRHR